MPDPTLISTRVSQTIENALTTVLSSLQTAYESDTTDRVPGPIVPRATWDGEGVNFALFSEHAERVELCLFDARGRTEVARVEVREQNEHVCIAICRKPAGIVVWLPRIRPLQSDMRGTASTPISCCSIRMRKRSRPHQMEPMRTSAIASAMRAGDLLPDRRNSASHMPKCQVIDPAFSWERRPRIRPGTRRNLRGSCARFTQLNPKVPEAQRGKYALSPAHPVIDYLKASRCDAVELMPVQPVWTDRLSGAERLAQLLGLQLHWLLRARIAVRDVAARSRVQDHGEDAALGRIEVILDVVYNHTAEGNHAGPTLSFRGIDNAAYYRLIEGDRRTTWTTPAVATRSTCSIRACAVDHGQPALLGLPKCTSTVSASISPRRWRVSCTPWIAGGFFEHHSSRPDHLAREAHRRTLGLG